MIRFVCECGKQLQAPEENAGKPAICPACQRQVIVPNESPPSDAVQQERPSRREAPEIEAVEIDDEIQRQLASSSGKAIASLVLGIFSLFCNFFTGLPALILGILALRDISRSRGRLSGQGLAIAGIVTGCAFTFCTGPILIGLLLPAVQKVREAASRAESQNNLRQLALGLLNYQSANMGQLPAAAICDKNGKPLLSWRVAILPYIEQEGRYKQFKLDEAWDGPHNIKLLADYVKVYMCLGDPNTPPDHTHYQVFVGNGAAFDRTRGHSFPQDFRDGISNTILIVEAEKAVPWTKPEDLDFDPNRPMLPLMSRRHYGGFNVALADGSVRFVLSNLSEKTFNAAITRKGNDSLGSDW